MRSLVPAFMVIALALLLLGGAGAQRMMHQAFNDTGAISAPDRPGLSPLSVRVTL